MIKEIEKQKLFKIVKLLKTPFNEWSAYKLDIINENGKILLNRNNFKNIEQYLSFGVLEELICHIKCILENSSMITNNYILYETVSWIATHAGSLEEIYDSQLSVIIEEFSSFLPSLKEEMVTAGSGGIAGIGIGKDGEPGISKKQQNWYTWNNSRVYVVPTDKFINARTVKNPYYKYSKYVGTDEVGEEIKNYGRTNPKANIILQDKQTGAMMYLRKRV